MDGNSASEIAEVIRDIRLGRVDLPPNSSDQKLFTLALELSRQEGPTVDATSIYHSLLDNPKPVYIYEDHLSIAPPWTSASVCYVNEHGNVIVLCFNSTELDRPATIQWDSPNMTKTEWYRVRWINTVVVWVGGKSKTLHQTIRPSGPLHIWRHAVYANGEPADIRWVHLMPDYPIERWDMANLVILGALNYMNCRNVDIIEPIRSRAESRRIAKTGVRVTTINVFPVGKTLNFTKSSQQQQGVPLTSVRGHFSCYGPDYGKGLLFGKLAGRFWIPQHARGDKTYGEIKHQYVLRPDS